MNKVDMKHDIYHIKIKKVEWICTCRTNECSVLTNAIRILSGIGPRYASSMDLLGPRPRSKCFNLRVCNRIKCFAFHSQNISVSKKKKDFNSN